MLNDLRYAVRTLLRSPGFALVTVLTLALGIGASTAIFSVVNAVLLRPLPYPQSDRLVDVWTSGLGGSFRLGLSYPYVQDVRNMRRDFAGVAAYATRRANMTGLGDPVEVQAAVVTPEMFSVLAIQPAIGRAFGAADVHQPVAMLSYATWSGRYGRDRSVLGKTITLDSRAYTVIGVLPPAAQFPDDRTELWLPIGVAFADDPQIEVNEHYFAFNVVARLAPGATVERAGADLSALGHRLDAAAASAPASQAGAPGAGPVRREIVARSSGGPGGGGPPSGGPKAGFDEANFQLQPLSRSVVGSGRTSILVLFGAVGVVMLIACVNAAGLLVARASGRRREIAVRRALGAGRGRIVRQLLTESVLLSLVAGAVGLALGAWGLEALLAAWPGVLPRVGTIGIDARVLVFTLLLAVATGVAFSLVPALRAAAPDVERTLRDDSAASVGARRRTHGALVVVEMALALVLLVGAGLLVRSFIRLSEIHPGFDPQNVLAARIRLTPSRYPGVQQQRDFFDQVESDLLRQPGVMGASLSRTLPLSGASMMLGMNPRDVRPDDPEQTLIVGLDNVDAGYFTTLRIPLLGGRVFGPADRAGAPKVAIVNDLLAKRLWPGESPIGKLMPLHSPGSAAGTATVIGEIAALRSGAIDRPPQPELYLAAAQSDASAQMWLAVRASAHPLHLASVVRDAVLRADPQQPIGEIVSLEQLIERQTAARRLTMALVSLFAAVAMTLAGIGMYGLAAYTVTRRTREFGIRVALGARSRDVLRMVLREHLRLVAAGAAAGVIIALGLTRVMRTMLYEVSPTDVPTFVCTVAGLALVGLLAALVPARRATRVDPMVALRHE
ncbi:MAG TPA: ABC transporter permease [Gemmatimonadaceae bacterium]